MAPPTLDRGRCSFELISCIKASVTMYAFPLPQEKHMRALWLPCNIMSILPDNHLVSAFFLFLWHGEKKNSLVFCLVILGIWLGGCWARLYCSQTELIRSVLASPTS